MMTANEIRDSYLKFFESKGHVIVPSAPMVIKDDPTLMFTNAGYEPVERILSSEQRIQSLAAALTHRNVCVLVVSTMTWKRLVVMQLSATTRCLRC